jgi:Tfp pilus assembly protein PilO
MWADLKMNHVNATRTRGEIIVIAIALAAIAVLLWSFTSVAQGQVQKAGLRDALRESQGVAIARCWQETPDVPAMRECKAQVRERTSMALDQSYGLPQRAMMDTMTQDSPMSVSAGASTVSMRY